MPRSLEGATLRCEPRSDFDTDRSWESEASIRRIGEAREGERQLAHRCRTQDGALVDIDELERGTFGNGEVLGVELVGALRQGLEPDALGFHRDAFLITKAVTLGWRPTFGPGTLILRAGAGSSLYKVEATRGLEHQAEREDTGTGWLAGIGYDFPLGRPISLGLDVVWSHLGVASDAGPDASFLSTTVGFRWHP